MSNHTDLAAVSPEQETVVVKQSLVAKTKTFVKTHKKATISVVALTGLVGVSALVGRKTAPTIDNIQLEGIYVEDSVDDTVA